MWEYLQYAIYSLIIILCLHFLYDYFINNFTHKNEKDVLSIQTQKYKKIIDDLTKENENKEKDLLEFALNQSE